MARKTLSTPPGTVAPPAKVPRMPPLPRKRRPGMLAFALVVVIGGAIAAGQGVLEFTDREPVVVMARDVPVGQQITRADLTTAMIGAESGVLLTPAREMKSVVDKVAAVSLTRGMLITSGAITESVNPTTGHQLVPVAVRPSKLPARGLKPGDLVLVIPAQENTTPDPKAKWIAAVVDKVKAPDTDGLAVVDLLVNEADGPLLAQQATGGHVALVLSPRGQ